MIIFEYIFIFFSKAIENALGTLRVIVIANNKKKLGAVLQVIISLVWIYSTAIVIKNFTKDVLKVIIFALGCGYGSYLGSYLENKMALGNVFLMCISNIKKGNLIADKIREEGFAVSLIEGEGKNDYIDILMILIERKQTNAIINIINSIDSDALVLTNNICHVSGGYFKRKKQL